MNSYDVGYKKPPQSTRFKKGNREYLKRSKKQSGVEAGVFAAIMSETIPTRKGERTVYRSRMEIVIDNFFAAALKGDIKAAEDLILLHTKFTKKNQMAPIFVHLFDEDRNC